MRNIVPDVAKWEDMDASQIVKSLLGTRFICPQCGNEHAVTLKMLEAKSGIMGEMADRIDAMGIKGKCLIVFDDNTVSLAGEGLLDSLGRYAPEPFVFHHPVHAGEKDIGRLIIAMKDNPDFLVACGSGSITDTVRFAAYSTGKPFVSFGTAASMDGYASGCTPLMVDGYKETYPGKSPEAIFADPAIVAAAPPQMTAAGFGDVLAKLIGLLDWRLAHDVEGEAYCSLIASLVDKAVRECIALADLLKGKDPQACAKLLEVLALTGVAMQMMGTSRPASGCEHQISHLLEMMDAQKGRPGTLHGDKVGIATLICMFMYLELFEKGMPVQRPIMNADTWRGEIKRVYGPLAAEVYEKNNPEPPQGALWEKQKRIIEKSMNEYGYEMVRAFKSLLPDSVRMIREIGGPTRPSELGYTVGEAYDAIAFGKNVREKFGILRIAERFGWVYDLAGEISQGLDEGKIY